MSLKFWQQLEQLLDILAKENQRELKEFLIFYKFF